MLRRIEPTSTALIVALVVCLLAMLQWVFLRLPNDSPMVLSVYWLSVLAICFSIGVQFIRAGLDPSPILNGLLIFSVVPVAPNVVAWLLAGAPLWGWRVVYEHNNGVALFNLLALAILATGQAQRRALIPWWLLFVWLTFYSASRSGALGLAAGLIVLWLGRGDRARTWIFWGAVTAPVLALVAAYFSGRGLFDLNSRNEYWGVAWQMFSSNVLLGTGLNSFQAHYISAYPNNPTFNHAHSLYLNTLAETGLVGFGLLVGSVVWLVIFYWQRRANQWAIASLSVLACFLAHSLTDTPGTAVFVALPLVLLLSGGFAKNPSPQEAPG